MTPDHRFLLPIPVLCAALCAALLLACGGDGLEAASQELEAIQAEVEQARAELRTREGEAQAATASLERAQANLERAEKRLVAARDRVEEATNDTVLFRAVQQRLLDESDLDGVAITARVERRTATLDGSVPHEKLKKLAEEIAQQTRGIETVVNRITVDVAAPGE